MKKIIIFVLLIIFCQSTKANDYMNLCSSKKPNKTIGGIISSISGINFLSRNIIESQIAKAIKKETNSKFSVKMNNFYAVNVLSGQFESLSAKSKSFYYDGMYFSNVNVKTLCPYNKVTYKDDVILFDENMLLEYNAQITQDDIDKMINSSEYQNVINQLNQDEIISSLMKIEDSKVELNGNKILFKYKVLALGGFNFFKKSQKPINLVFSADLKVMDGKIKICNFGLNSKIIGYNMFLPIINKLNPTNWNIEIDKNNKGTMTVKNITIANSIIKTDGIIFIPKNKWD